LITEACDNIHRNNRYIEKENVINILINILINICW